MFCWIRAYCNYIFTIEILCRSEQESNTYMIEHMWENVRPVSKNFRSIDWNLCVCLQSMYINIYISSDTDREKRQRGSVS